MNKKEKQVILNQYQLILDIEKLGYDKSDSIREFSQLIDSLDMKKERYIVENKVLAKHKGYSIIAVDAFNMIFESLLKYDCLINYDIDEVEEILENLKWEMNEEEFNYNLKRISIIKESIGNTR